jgi:2,3-bisphosphoglycerate-dependent phosphoglycerate mutase
VGTLVVVRHGESVWNADPRFTGWVDVALTDRGRRQAVAAGTTLRDAGLLPDVAFSSVLRRSVESAAIILDRCDRAWVPMRHAWRLNERHYGAWQGRWKAEFASSAEPMRGGAPGFEARLAYGFRPPPIEPGSTWDTSRDAAYRYVAPDLLPRSESLADTFERVLPFLHDEVWPLLVAGRTVLLATHANVVRSMVARAGGFGDLALQALAIPSATPMVWDLVDGRLRGRAGVRRA